MLTQKKLREILKYNPDTGEFSWNITAGSRRHGSKAGCVNHYIYIKIDKVKYPAHRLAYLYQTGGQFNDLDIDHINGIKTDNRWGNLRLAKRYQNAGNAKLRYDNELSLKNIRQLKDTGKYQVRVSGKSYGSYLDLNMAISVAESARKKVFQEYARAC